MTALLHDLFGTGKADYRHAPRPRPAGPATPRRGSRPKPILDALARDLDALQAAGVDGLLFCNEADLPYRLETGPETAAAMAALVGELRQEIHVPFGIDIVWDPVASLAVARATGACFVREVFTGAYESDLGLMRPGRRATTAEDVAVFANITPEFASSLGQGRPQKEPAAPPSWASTPSSSPARSPACPPASTSCGPQKQPSPAPPSWPAPASRPAR